MTDISKLRTTLGDLLDRQAERLGDHEALVHLEHGLRYSYAGLRAECDRVARGLLSLGIHKGDHVGIWATNYPEWVVAQFATAKIGAVLVTVNPAYRTHELEYLLGQSDARALILISTFRSSNYVAMLNEVVPALRKSAPGQLRTDKLPYLRDVIFIPPYPREAGQEGQETPPGMWGWDEVREGGEKISPEVLAQRQQECDPDDVINIQYTSGTTGNPKGAMLTHLNIVANATYLGEGLHFTERDRLSIPVPLYHCFGCVIGTLLCLTQGATMVFPSEHFDPLKTLIAVEQERCTALHGVPTMFIAELGHPDFEKFDLSSLRTGIMAGSPCPIEVMRQVIDRMGVREITIAYGQTEAAPAITLTSTDDTIEHRVSTVGPPMPNVEVRIVDPETGQEVPRGQQGELWARSFMNMKGYYKMPEATAAAIDSEGWLHTGDLATMDEDGYCKITGRLKDMIIRGGENVYPREIEEFLYTNPKIADVQVIGVPDLRFVEEVMAWVMLKSGQTATEEEIKEFCRGKIAHYKVPRYVKFVSEFPMTVTGKIQKFRMREMAIEELGLMEAARMETA
ncbi:MAG TPA: AMP-binding protein [Dehalococcoidia bacterium]|nr:AMP-binding protein [Dehalococcoidia bacterium]